MYEPEPAVVRAAAAGDRRALESLIRAAQADVWRFARHLLGDDALAEDVAQETFIRMFLRLDSYQFQSKFSTWVFSITRNAAIDATRARARRDRLADRAGSPPSTPDAVARAELRAALATLPHKLHEALVTVEVLGFTYREAATVLDVPEGTVKSRVFQARERLTTWFADSEGATGEV